MPPTKDLTGYSVIKADLQIGADGSWCDMALQVGDTWYWCQGTGEWIPQDTTMTAELNLYELCANRPT